MATQKHNAIITLTDGEVVGIRIKPALLNALRAGREEDGMDIGEMVNYALSVFAECNLGFEHKYVKAPAPQKRVAVKAVSDESAHTSNSEQDEADFRELQEAVSEGVRQAHFALAAEEQRKGDAYNPIGDSMDAEIKYLDENFSL